MNESRRRGTLEERGQPSTAEGAPARKQGKPLEGDDPQLAGRNKAEISEDRIVFGESGHFGKKQADGLVFDAGSSQKDSQDERGMIGTAKSKNGSMHIQNFNFFIKNTNSNTRRDEVSPGVGWRKQRPGV